MRQVIAIGGGGFGRSQESNLIEQYILDQTSKKNPKICFIPTATGDLDPYIVNFYSVFAKLKCAPSHISFFKRTVDLQAHIQKQDAIFVGGGNTKSMLAVWRDWGLDLILKDAYDRGVVMSGVSAGAICWFEGGLTDSWESDLKMMECMNFIPGNCAPHYDEEPERKPSLSNFISNGEISDCFAIDGGCALHLKNDQVFKSISFMNGKNSFLIKNEKGRVTETSLPKISL